MPQNQLSDDIISVGDNTFDVIGKEPKSAAGHDISSTLTIDLAARQRTTQKPSKEGQRES